MLKYHPYKKKLHLQLASISLTHKVEIKTICHHTGHEQKVISIALLL